MNTEKAELFTPAPEWSGRSDGPGPEHARWHSVINQSTDSPAPVTLLGFASDEGVLRNGGRQGAAAGPAALRAALGSLAVHHEHALADAPPIISSLNIAVAETSAAARDLLLPEAYAKVRAQSTGEFATLRPAGELDMDALTGQQRRRIEEALAHDVWGTVEEVREELRGVGKRLGVSEFVVTGDMPDIAGRARSEELLASMQVEN